MPEAVPRALQFLWAELGPETMDRVWIFPPLVSGRTESGLLAVSRYVDSEDPDRRALLTLPYGAERSGKGLTVDRTLEEQGEAPLDRFPRVMEGVVHRTESDLGEPVELIVEGTEERLAAFLSEFDPGLLDPDLPPLHRGEAIESEAADGDEVPDPESGDNPWLEAPAARATETGEAPATDDDPFDLYASESAS
ncbi:MAG: hypothetical protein JSU98_03570 [Gemmatimonadales bacterium]|nr:MAG: hypothetical protein JSU98_03570 [Gemmatimonadales bacterium]